ncbi:lipoprotein-releasing system ATP-binding protein [Tindallia magadiensis]|uniref:Lipoprotein-releasing system ATP-binding protein n=1 Tax=Tindallia magadiensis TaxID=69895 RepID=A0A1I3CXX5_9FIRM|nr:ABC transporter ATP-binding protein [Tindallia magadiensis]SFH79277.1 lipoprotein-releasing system ATP-binding protein [Tindallia magadiensis]
MGCVSLLEMKGITKVYGTTIKTKALGGIDLKFETGEFSSIIGYSGSGKTTLLNILGALDRPTEGSVWFQEGEVTAMSDRELADFRNRNIGFIFQFHHLLPEFTALENVLIPTWIKSHSSSRAKEGRAKELLELVGLKERLNNKATDLSGGQQQRVAIARSLINEPAIILADEPTGNLDSETTEQVYELMREINTTLNTAFILVTHNDHIAAKSDRIIEMKDGLILKDYLTSKKSREKVWEEVAPKYCRHCYEDSEESQLL